MWFFKKKSRSSKRHEDITDYELELIRAKRGCKCPDCAGSLMTGPMGGAAMNTMCDKCFAEFNLFLFNGQVLGGERMNDKGEVRAERKSLYGLSIAGGS